MAIECSLKLEDEVLTKELIFKQLAEFGIHCSTVIELPKGFRIDETWEPLGFSLSLIDTSGNPFGYESKFLPEDFPHKQNLGFRLNDDYDSVKAIHLILRLVFTLVDHLKVNVLFLFNDNECFHIMHGTLVIHNENKFWDRPEYNQFIENREYQITV